MSQQSKGSSTTNNLPNFARSSQKRWLKLYYFIRTAFSAVWVAAALTVDTAPGLQFRQCNCS